MPLRERGGGGFSWEKATKVASPISQGDAAAVWGLLLRCRSTQYAKVINGRSPGEKKGQPYYDIAEGKKSKPGFLEWKGIKARKSFRSVSCLSYIIPDERGEVG